MPATHKTARGQRPSEAVRERYEQNGRAIDRLAKSLEAAQADLSALRGTVGAGAGDLRKDIAKLLRDARRDVGKLNKAVRRDLDRVKKDLSAAAPGGTRARRGTRTATAASKPRARGASRRAAK
jgi:hypothetical protein